MDDGFAHHAAMLAITQRTYGAPLKVLTVEDLPIPTPTDDQVLVRIHAASVNAGGWNVIRGEPFPALFMTW